ncbi:aspartic proteinase Asp1-like [Tripterygium wilfordii]|uniref:aspartic proteinase Asp1-like n=1 Tax=Tripterygium wilfordii TaxID=458696 RepID=UPI0018F857F4|nr:aspartic proteinase Asp1-like [Tripterygium wilfordii]
MVVVLFCIIFQSYFSKALGASSVVFPVNKNDHTGRAYFTNINIGSLDKSFELHIDSGSDITWVECDENNMPGGNLYKPPADSMVKCDDPLCVALHGNDHECLDPSDRCHYEFDHYGDGKSTEGYLVRDIFPLQLINGSVIHPHLVFGCGYKQTGDFNGNGLLGLGRGGVSLLSQMHSQDLINKVTGHCLSSGEGGGFLFLGNDLVPPSGVSWTSINNEDNDLENYLTGPVDLLLDEREIQVRKMEFDFDSGLDSSYLNQPTYEYILHLIQQFLEGSPLIPTNRTRDFSMCWRHSQQPIRSLDDITHLFKKLTLKFKDSPNINILEIPSKNYLILVGDKVCLGISNGDQDSNLDNVNVIGVNFMQDKLVIYDSVESRMGWTPSRSCHMSPRTRT